MGGEGLDTSTSKIAILPSEVKEVTIQHSNQLSCARPFLIGKFRTNCTVCMVGLCSSIFNVLSASFHSSNLRSCFSIILIDTGEINMVIQLSD